MGPRCCPSHGQVHPWVHSGVHPMEGSTHGSTLVSFQWRRVHPWVPSGRHSLEHQWWLHPAVHPMEGSTHGSMLCPSNGRGCNHGSQGPSTGWSTHGSMLCPSNGRGCTHGSQGANIGWSINGGSMLVSIPWKREHPWVPRAEHRVEHLWVHAAVHPMARCTHGSMLCPSNGGGCTHGSQGANIGWSISGGSVLVSIPWKREHPWVHAGVLPMEEGAPMGPKEQTSVGASVMALCWFPSHGRVHPWVPRAEHRVEHQWIHAAVHPVEEGAPMGPL